MSFAESFAESFPGGQVRYCPWLICEDSQRFSTAAKRFASGMISPAAVSSAPLAVPSVQATTLANFGEQVEPLIGSGVPCVVLWHFQRADLLTVLDQVMSLARDSRLILGRRVLPIVACDWLGRDEELALAEIGVSVFVRHPEDLLKFAPVIQAHFASFASGLK